MKIISHLLNTNQNDLKEESQIVQGKKSKEIWALITDSHLARLYKKNDHQLVLVTELEKEEEIIEIEDNQRTIGCRTHVGKEIFRHGFSLCDSKENREIVSFIQEISAYLEKTIKMYKIDKLILICPPKVLSFFRKNLNERVKKVIVAEVSKDYIQLDNKKLEDALEKIIWF